MSLLGDQASQADPRQLFGEVLVETLRQAFGGRRAPPKVLTVPRTLS